MSALDKQIGGDHYKDFTIQPVEFIHRNGIDFLSGNVIKYICRWKSKGGLNDLEKAKHYIELLMELSDTEKFNKNIIYCKSCSHQINDDELNYSLFESCKCKCHLKYIKNPIGEKR